jgi:hypothetical protein
MQPGDIGHPPCGVPYIICIGHVIESVMVAVDVSRFEGRIGNVILVASSTPGGEARWAR